VTVAQASSKRSFKPKACHCHTLLFAADTKNISAPSIDEPPPHWPDGIYSSRAIASRLLLRCSVPIC
jgi:hypothetical protein